jgi:hypothetical protein
LVINQGPFAAVHESGTHMVINQGPFAAVHESGTHSGRRRKSGFGTVRTRGGAIPDDSKGRIAVHKPPAFSASHMVPNTGFWEEIRANIST